jgi:uncharacterized membrane protein
MRDQLGHLSRRAAHGIDVGVRDLANRAKGTPYKLRSILPGSGGNGPRQQPSATPRGRPIGTGWPPAWRLLAAGAGTALMVNCLLRRTPAAALAGTFGFGIFTRAVTNKPVAEALGLSGPGYAVDVERTIEIDAPVNSVFDFFSHPENYLRISDSITQVEVLGDGRYAKDMLIAGIPVRFQERVITCEQNRLIETHSEPESMIRYCKQIRFQELAAGRTRVHLRFSYSPPAGVVGHVMATMIGCDADSLLIDLLMRAKFFLETGREPHDAVGRQRQGNCRQQSISTAAESFTPDGQARGHAPTAVPGPHREKTLGPGSPMNDVWRPGVERATGEPAWPPSNPPLPQPAGPGSRFPAAPIED